MAETRLKNGSDWRSWTAFRDGSEAASAGVNRSKKGTVEQARRLVIRAYHRRAWGLPGGEYRLAAARLTAAGYPTKEKDFKNAARGALVENTIPEMAVREFIAAICAIWPAFEWQRLVTPQEPASEPGKKPPKPAQKH